MRGGAAATDRSVHQLALRRKLQLSQRMEDCGLAHRLTRIDLFFALAR